MSATSETRQSRRNANGEGTTPPAAEEIKTAAVTTYGTSSIKIDGNEVEVPVRWSGSAGVVLDDNLAQIVQTAVERQFSNNMTANAIARAKRLAAATTDEDRAANQPWTADQYATAFLTYMPSIGDTPRQSALDKMRGEAAWAYWVDTMNRHNKAVAEGGAAVIVKAVDGEGKPFVVTPPTGKGSADKREAMIATLLAAPSHAAGIQTKLDEMVAARSVKAPVTTGTVKQSSADLI